MENSIILYSCYFCSMLQDLKVIELAGVLAGPAVGMFFVEMGAQVTKIENPLTGGDITRQWKIENEDINAATSSYFASVNWNKKHLFLNYTKEDKLQQLYALIADADVLICNWKQGDALRYKLDFQTILKLNPTIIYGCITGFGDDVNRVAYDAVLQAETGWMFMNGEVDEKPLKIPVAIIYLFAAHQLKEGILIALINKLKTGEGCEVSVSLYDAAIAALANQASNYLNTGNIPKPIGSLHPNIAPYGEIITCADGKQLLLAIGTDKQFKQFCDILDCSFLSEDERFSSNKNRVKNRTVLMSIIYEKPIEFKGKELLDICIKKGIPVGTVNNLEEVFQNPQAQKLILEDAIGKRVKTAVFKITKPLN